MTTNVLDLIGQHDNINYLGNWDASTGSYPSNPNAGHMYRVSVAGSVTDTTVSPNETTTYDVDQLIVYTGSQWLTVGSGAGGGVITYQSDVIDTDMTLTSSSDLNVGYFIDTTNGPITIDIDYTNIDLKPGETQIVFTDYAGTFDQNNFSFDPAPEPIHGINDYYLSTEKNESLTFTYADATRGFLLTGAR